MRESGEALVKELGITKGLDVLDLGCGDGTTAVPAARHGANVLGVDIAGNLVEAGNKRAANSASQTADSRRVTPRTSTASRTSVRPRREHLRRHVRPEAL